MTDNQGNKLESGTQFIYNKGFNDNTGQLNYDIIKNIDIKNSKNIIPLSTLEPKITDSESNVMLNIVPIIPLKNSSFTYGINNELNQSFSGSFYVSFNTELLLNNNNLYIGKIISINVLDNIEITIEKNNNIFSIIFYSNDTNKKVKITEYINDEKKILTFLVMFKYDKNESIIRFVINEDESNEVSMNSRIILKSLMFGGKVSDTVEFKSIVENNEALNCYVGGIKVYNEVFPYKELKNKAFYKIKPPTPTKTEVENEKNIPISNKTNPNQNNPSSQIETKTSSPTKQPITTTTTQQAVNKLLVSVYNSDTGIGIDPFTNYSPSAELFTNI